MNRNANKKAPSKTDVEAVLALALVVLLVVAVIVGIVIAVTMIGRGATDPNGPQNDNPRKNAVFNNGVVPQKPVASQADAADIHSPYGVIVDIDTGEILAAKNADAQFEPASMTKVMTLIVALEKLTQEDLNGQIAYTSYYATYDYQGLARGITNPSAVNDRFSIKGLLYGIGVVSAGDCTLMIAEYTYGSMEAFVEAMNQKVTELGLTKTKFIDASGNNHIKGNTTTASEMAVIMAYAMQCPLICDILSTDYYSCPVEYTDEDGTTKNYQQPFASTLFEYAGCKDRSNRMYRYKIENDGQKFKLNTTDGFMGKTGYLDTPDRSYLVCAATGNESGHRYVVVVGETSKFASTMKDVKYLFDNYAR